MDNSYQQGDLADIVRATATTTTTTTTDQMLGWQFEPSNLDPYTYSGPLTPDLSTGIPFVDMGLLQGPMSSVPDPVQDNNTNSANYSISTSTSNTSTSNKFEQNHGYGLVSTEMMSVNGSIKGYKDGFIDNTTTTSTGVHHQIPSPSNTGIKRRKSQAKKVVCIPAPAAANNRQTGEVVPSDLWAWRKYGQKPIKGSPYPRGYYRCSSSKGCSARKQVERSRTDPNMLVITYTSEHNHPWPTQRNALAGSTRSQPSKISIGSTTSPNKLSSTVITTNDINNNDNDNNHTNSNVLVKDEFNNDKNTFHESNNNNCGNALMKDENVGVGYDKLVESNISRKDVNNNNVVVNEVLLEDVDTSYRPEMPESSGQQQPTDHDFFADLVGFSGDDPFNLLFTQENKTFNPFGAGAIFDWAPPNNTTTTNNDLDNYSTTYNGQGKGES